MPNDLNRNRGKNAEGPVAMSFFFFIVRKKKIALFVLFGSPNSFLSSLLWVIS